MLRLLFALITSFSGVTWADAETIDVKYYGKLDLAPFACTEVTRSSFVSRACYDKANQFMVVQLRTLYYPYCVAQGDSSKFVTGGGPEGCHGAATSRGIESNRPG